VKNKTIKVDYLARVEGEGGLYIKTKGDEVVETKLNIFEPPRFFEAFLRGRHFTEAPDITARICGICPIAYQMSSTHAMENICGVKIDGQLRALRRLIYCGEWIESHVLHIYMLHAPDFLGLHDVIQIAKKHPELVKKALQLKKHGNDIVNLVGGREIHPINVRIGGFYKVPRKSELKTLIEPLKWAVDAAIDTVKFAAKLPFPDFEQDYHFVALRHPDEYPFNEGRLVSSKGIDIEISAYEDYFQEEHMAHANALHSLTKTGDNYFTGPIARYNLNFDRLPEVAKQVARSIKFPKFCRNPFQSIIVRGIETVFACVEALRIINEYEEPEKAAVEVEPKAGVGYGCTEAPRGILFHKYRIDDKGIIQEAKIVPPTSQNQRTIENDLRHYVKKYINLPLEKLTWQCEQAVRNYDPCISCATHFLKLKIDRG